MISKQELVGVPNTILMASMYGALCTTNHAVLNPRMRADFDYLYVIEMLKAVIFTDIKAKQEENALDENATIDRVQQKYSKDAKKLTESLDAVSQTFSLKNERLVQLENLQANFYDLIEEYGELKKLYPVVNLRLDTASYYNTLSFDESTVCVDDHMEIYNHKIKHMVDAIKVKIVEDLENEKNANA